MIPNGAGLKLREILDAVLADKNLEPHKNDDGEITKTFCNSAVQIAAENVGYHDKLNKKMANQIMALLEAEAKKHKAWVAWSKDRDDNGPERGDWCEVDGQNANLAANLGLFSIAAVYAKPHGHVASVYPGAMLWSTKWGKECPVVANVGQRNGVMGANWAFKDEPRYFACLALNEDGKWTGRGLS